MNKSKKVILSISILVLTAASCGKGGQSTAERSPRNSARNLTIDSFNTGTTPILNSTDFAKRLKASGQFLNDDGSAPSTPGAFELCYQNKIAGYKFTRSASNAFNLSVEDTDVSGCYSTPGFTVQSCIISEYYENIIAKDAFGSVVNLEGKNLSDISGLNLVQWNYRAYSNMKAAITSTSTPYEVTTLSGSHAAGNFNAPCVAGTTLDNCRQQVVMQFHYSGTPSLDYTDRTVFDVHSLGVVSGAPYYTNGTMTFAINNWSGTMTYGSDPFTAPTYTATDTKGLYGSTSGTFSYAAAILKPGTASGLREQVLH